MRTAYHWNQLRYHFYEKNLIKTIFSHFLGLNTSLVPMYVSEISPLNLRGGLGTVNQLAVTVGLLLSQVLGIEQILGNNEGWPLLLGLAVLPAVLQLLLLPVCPESPRYLLITKQWEEESRRALRRLRASNQVHLSHSCYILWFWPGGKQVEEDIEEMRAEERAQQSESSTTMSELLCSPTLRVPLMISVVLQLSQQLSGINAVSVSINNGHYHPLGMTCRCSITQRISSRRPVWPQRAPNLPPSVSGALWWSWLWSPYLWWIEWADGRCYYTVLEECLSSRFSSPFLSWSRSVVGLVLACDRLD